MRICRWDVQISEKMKTLKIALGMPLWLEYTNLLTEGAVSYGQGHPELRLMELPVQAGSPEWAGRRPFPFDGVLTFANAHSDDWVQNLHREGIPVVNCSADLMEEEIPCVLGGGCAV